VLMTPHVSGWTEGMEARARLIWRTSTGLHGRAPGASHFGISGIGRYGRDGTDPGVGVVAQAREPTHYASLSSTAGSLWP
jgi:hypothetical protein